MNPAALESDSPDIWRWDKVLVGGKVPTLVLDLCDHLEVPMIADGDRGHDWRTLCGEIWFLCFESAG